MKRYALALGAVAGAMVACTSHGSRGAGASAGASASATASASASASASAEAGADAGEDAGEEEEVEKTFDEILRVLFAERSSEGPILAACPVSLPADARVRCLYDERYKGDPKAAGIAHGMFVKWRILAGVEVGHVMDGGYRGKIQIESAVPVGENRHHLEWVAAAISDIDTFFGELEKYRVQRDGASSTRSVRYSAHAPKPRPYRFEPMTIRFMRSVGVRTPAAYALDWEVAYNFNGSLNVSADAVRETMFHEIFHLNDAAHGGWSPGALGDVFDFIVKKCGTKTPCLTPYTPAETMVRGGTYYSFQPGNGVVEYAAELASRYYREQRAVLRGLPKVKAFKCGPPENAKAWALIRDELFAGVDAVPACP